ncbi:MAG: PCRF domain-containing protein [Polyangiales bacterium]
MPDDDQDAILSVNAGAGGTDAQDWAEILFRMYQRWAEKHAYRDQGSGPAEDQEFGGIASTSILAKGPNAYGFLRAENGVHRLIRVSRCSESRRETASSPWASCWISTTP